MSVLQQNIWLHRRSRSAKVVQCSTYETVALSLPAIFRQIAREPHCQVMPLSAGCLYSSGRTLTVSCLSTWNIPDQSKWWCTLPKETHAELECTEAMNWTKRNRWMVTPYQQPPEAGPPTHSHARNALSLLTIVNPLANWRFWIQ